MKCSSEGVTVVQHPTGDRRFKRLYPVRLGQATHGFLTTCSPPRAYDLSTMNAPNFEDVEERDGKALCITFITGCS